MTDNFTYRQRRPITIEAVATSVLRGNQPDVTLPGWLVKKLAKGQIVIRDDGYIIIDGTSHQMSVDSYFVKNEDHYYIVEGKHFREEFEAAPHVRSVDRPD